MGNARVDIMAVIKTRGLTFVKDLVPEAKTRHRVFVAFDGAEMWAVKAATAAEEIGKLRTEAKAHQMLRALTPRNARFCFPATEILEDRKTVFVSKSPFVASSWYATAEPFKMRRDMDEDDLEDVFQVMLFLHRIKKSQLTPFLRKEAMRFTLKERLAFHARYLAPAIGTLCTKKEAQQLVAMMKDVGYKRRFVHHDIGPTNMARLADGRLLVIDAEYARWEMKWYDAAYSFLQLSVLHGEEELAKRWLFKCFMRFGEALPREDFRREIFFPLGYWIAANLFMAMDHPEQRDRARKMFERILKRDFSLLLE